MDIVDRLERWTGKKVGDPMPNNWGPALQEDLRDAIFEIKHRGLARGYPRYPKGVPTDNVEALKRALELRLGTADSDINCLAVECGVPWGVIDRTIREIESLRADREALCQGPYIAAEKARYDLRMSELRTEVEHLRAKVLDLLDLRGTKSDEEVGASTDFLKRL
jgi:hypothetical protein